MTIINKRIGSILLFITALLIFASCTMDSTATVTQLPTDVTELYKEKGDTSSTKVILYAQGGPVTTLSTNYFDSLGLSSYHEVYVHQTNTYARILQDLNINLSFERAIKENEQTVEIMYRVAKHFSDKGKTVYMVGHSFGAFMMPAYIAKYHSKGIIEKYLIAAGRLDMPDVVWQGFRDRIGYQFENGVTPVKQTGGAPDGYTTQQINETYAGMRLQAGYGKNRNTTLLAGMDLSSVIYAYGELDPAVGRLSDDEVSFLEGRGAYVYKVTDGNHGSMINAPHRTTLVQKLFE